MQRILVTGGNGGLGRAVVARLAGAGPAVRVMSRQPAAPGAPAAYEWAQADLATGAGLGAALAGVDVVVHAATSSARHTREVDVDGTQRLIAAARAAGVRHLVYISIVGTDQVPFAYYRHKAAAEQVVERGGLPWTILRATQFHTLLDGMLAWLARWPLFVLPAGFVFQPIETGEVARCLAELALGEPQGRAPDIGGPEVLRLEDLAVAWLAAHGQRRQVVALPLPGTFAAAVRQGRLTCPEQRYGTITWASWLRDTYAPRVALA